MLTEQEVAEVINKKIADKTLKASTAKYVEKLKVLQGILKAQQTALEELKKKVVFEEEQALRTKGAISVLLELSAEEEGLLSPTSP
jgi:hypothetical protein